MMSPRLGCSTSKMTHALYSSLTLWEGGGGLGDKEEEGIGGGKDLWGVVPQKILNFETLRHRVNSFLSALCSSLTLGVGRGGG